MINKRYVIETIVKFSVTRINAHEYNLFNNLIKFYSGATKHYFDIEACSINGERLKTRARMFAINNSIGTISSLANWMATDYGMLADVYASSNLLNHGFPNFKATHPIGYFRHSSSE